MYLNENMIKSLSDPRVWNHTENSGMNASPRATRILFYDGVCEVFVSCLHVFTAANYCYRPVNSRAHFLRHPRYKNVSGNKKRKTTTEMQTMKIPHEEQQVRHQIWTSAKRQIYKDFQKKCWWDVGVNCCCSVCVTRRSLMHQPSEY